MEDAMVAVHRRLRVATPVKRLAIGALIVLIYGCRTLREQPLDAAASDAETDAAAPTVYPCVEAGSCDPVSNLGCEGETKCWVFSGVEGDTACVPEGRGRHGDPCAQVVDCVRGHSCNNGRCYAVCCSGDDRQCAAYGNDAGASRCAVEIINSSSNPAFDNVRSCTFPCDPFAQDCPDGMTCFPQSTTVRTCAQAGRVAVGARCSRTVGECVAGAVCAYVTTDAGRAAQCLRVCDPRRSDSCPDGGACLLVGSGVGACH